MGSSVKGKDIYDVLHTYYFAASTASTTTTTTVFYLFVITCVGVGSGSLYKVPVKISNCKLWNRKSENCSFLFLRIWKTSFWMRYGQSILNIKCGKYLDNLNCLGRLLQLSQFSNLKLDYLLGNRNYGILYSTDKVQGFPEWRNITYENKVRDKCKVEAAFRGSEAADRLQHMYFLCEKLNIDCYPSARNYSENQSHYCSIQQIIDQYSSLEFNQKTQEPLNIVLTGRIMRMRCDKMFLDIQDCNANIQVYVDKFKTPLSNKESVTYQTQGLYSDQPKNVSLSSTEITICDSVNRFPPIEEIIKFLDVGDYVEILSDKVRRTRTGELTVNANSIRILSKCVLPLPDKYKGIKEKELQHRKRYLCIMTNRSVKEKIKARFLIVSEVRKILNNLGFLEVDTPILSRETYESDVNPFRTFHNSLGKDVYLRISPEIHLKELIISGIADKICEISKSFRNEGLSSRHSSEFISAELYVVNANYLDMMNLTERIINQLVGKFCESQTADIEINNDHWLLKIVGKFDKMWKTESFEDLLKSHTNFSLRHDAFMNTHTALIAAKEFGVNLSYSKEQQAKMCTLSKESEENNQYFIIQILSRIFDKIIAPKLIYPTHVTKIPSSLSPLSQEWGDNNCYAERFETYIGGMEIADGYTELANPFIQKEKLFKQWYMNNILNSHNNPANIDHSYLEALCYGMPPTGGVGIGLERVAMILTKSNHIKDIAPFPLLI